MPLAFLQLTALVNITDRNCDIFVNLIEGIIEG